MSGNEEFIQEFLVECDENLDQLEQDLIVLEADPRNQERLASVFRAVHTIKGTSGFFGFAKLGALAHAGETLLSRLRDGELLLSGELASALLALMDAIREILGRIEQQGHEGDADYGPVAAQLARLAAQPGAPAPDSPETAASDAARDAPEPVTASDTPEPVAPVPPAMPTPAAAAPAGLSEHGSPAAGRSESGLPEDRIAAALDAEASSADARDSEEPEAAVVPAAGDLAREGTVRVDVALLNRLMNLVGELVLSRNQIRPFTDCIPDLVFAGATQQLDLITSELQAGIMQTRMQPLSNIWSKFPRVVRDLAQRHDKQVQLEMQGQDTELDRTLLEAIKDPLTHLLRNAVDHGIETPAARRACGKPETGRVRLRAYHEGGLVNIEIVDDGAGIDADRVKQKALELGLITRADLFRQTESQIMQLIFLPGLSTAAQLTDISGRGVGMDVVKTNLTRIGGSITLESKLGQGTLVRLKIPLTLAIIPALVVTCRNRRYAIPQVSLREIIPLPGSAEQCPVEWIDKVAVYRLRDELIPLIWLDRVLQVPRAEVEARNRPAHIAVLQAVGHRFGLVVDDIQNAEEIVVKPLHPALAKVQVLSGATIMGDGQVALILDVSGMARTSDILATAQLAPAPAGPLPAAPSAERGSEYLLCEQFDHHLLAVPVADVARLEHLPVDRVQQLNNRRVVAYHGHVLHLLQFPPAVGPANPLASGANLPVVVHRVGDQYVGLEVRRFLDSVRVTADPDRSTPTPGSAGRALIDGQVVEVVDLGGLARASGLKWERALCSGATS